MAAGAFVKGRAARSAAEAEDTRAAEATVASKNFFITSPLCASFEADCPGHRPGIAN
jgi:hypothetical protein